MRRRTWGVALAVLAAGMVPLQARAQTSGLPALPVQPHDEPPAATPPPATAQPAPEAIPPDIVKLKNGSLFRGTVMELVAGDHVDVRLPSGETKRFPMSDVDYAGPASGAPGATAPPASSASAPAPPPAVSTPARPFLTIDGTPARVHFEATTPETDFHIRNQDISFEGGGFGVMMRGGLYGFASSGEGHGYLRICVAPCDATMPVGKYRLALSREGKKPVEPDDAVEISGPSVVHGTYVSRSGTRAAGWVIFGLSVATGLGLMIAGAAQQNCSQGFSGFGSSGSTFCVAQPDAGLITAGAAVTIVGSLLSLAFTLQHDRAEITVDPE